MSERVGYRGYIGSRTYNCGSAPQHVQNLVVRDYCQRNGFNYLLSATEYAMDSCYMMLEQVLLEAPELQGIVMYSLFMLPMKSGRRLDMVKRILASGSTLHGAVENISIVNAEDLECTEDVWRVNDHVLGRGWDKGCNADRRFKP